MAFVHSTQSHTTPSIHSLVRHLDASPDSVFSGTLLQVSLDHSVLPLVLGNNSIDVSPDSVFSGTLLLVFPLSFDSSPLATVDSEAFVDFVASTILLHCLPYHCTLP